MVIFGNGMNVVPNGTFDLPGVNAGLIFVDVFFLCIFCLAISAQRI